MGLDIDVYKDLKKSAKNSDKPKYKDIAYFRKVNFLYAFFRDSLNKEDSWESGVEYATITKEQIEKLVENCKLVLQNHDRAEELLPTSSGFFFGSLEYNDYYFESVADVLKTFQEVLDEYDEDYCYGITFDY